LLLLGKNMNIVKFVEKLYQNKHAYNQGENQCRLFLVFQEDAITIDLEVWTLDNKSHMLKKQLLLDELKDMIIGPHEFANIYWETMISEIDQSLIT